MTDIFDEKEDIKNVRSFVAFLRGQYETELHEKYRVSTLGGTVEEREYVDPEELRSRNRLATHWPGDDIVGQIVKDTCRLLINNELEPGDIL
jgi:hypothetical protein